MASRERSLVLACGAAALLACCGNDPTPARPDATVIDRSEPDTTAPDTSPPDAAEDGWSAQDASDAVYKTCDWGEYDSVACGAASVCPANSRCVSSSACMCTNGQVAVDCEGRPCADGACGPGQWYCLRPMARSAGMCAGWPVRVAATAPVYRCTLPNDANVNDTITRLNALWSSELRACPCESDALSFVCRGNALVSIDSPGVIQYDRALLQMVTEAVGNDIAAALVIGHEAGHALQLTLATVSERTIQNELLADCLAGYFLGSLECQNKIQMDDFNAAFMSICRGADVAGTPWWAPTAHGTCEQRQGAVNRGLNGFREGAAPFVTCRIIGH